MASCTHSDNPPSTPRKRKPLSTIPNPDNAHLSFPAHFTTPRRRKQPHAPPSSSPVEHSWPRLGAKIPVETLIQATRELYGYAPRSWQLDVFNKVAEGYDAIALAGTGYGKSLVFGLLAIAAALSEKGGMVLVISPLKALQKDQVHRFSKTCSLTIDGVVRQLRVSAIAINEDNNDSHVFDRLSKGKDHLVYASPECLLNNERFKQAFRREDFRSRVVAIVVDEAHVIQGWKDNFRKDYGELESLRVIVGMEIPWLALTATASTSTFETIYTTLHMGQDRPFYGLDLGPDRPNLAQWVRPMEYAANSMLDLVAFIPVSPTSPSQLDKSIFYFKTRQDARRACRKIRAIIPQFKTLVYTFTASASEDYKDEVMRRFHEGTIRILCATIAAGMGTDVPDITRVVIFGVDSLHSAYQKGGRAGRSAEIAAQMVWIVEKWAFNAVTGTTSSKVTKKGSDNERRRSAMDRAAREYINRSQSMLCMRRYAVDYFRPKPQLPGFPDFASEATDENAPVYEVEWVVAEQEIAHGSNCGCNAACCRTDPQMPVGLLTLQDHKNIAIHAQAIQVTSQMTTPLPTEPHAAPSAFNLSTNASERPQLRCSKPEKDSLREALETWRDTSWGLVRHETPFLSHDWILSPGNISKLVDKAHVFLNSPNINEELLDSVFVWMGPDELLESLLELLKSFKKDYLARACMETVLHQAKRVARNNRKSNEEGNEASELPPVETSLQLQWQLPIQVRADQDPFIAGFSPIIEWQIPDYNQVE